MKKSASTGVVSSMLLTGTVALLVWRWFLFWRRPRASASGDLARGGEGS